MSGLFSRIRKFFFFKFDKFIKEDYDNSGWSFSFQFLNFEILVVVSICNLGLVLILSLSPFTVLKRFKRVKFAAATFARVNYVVFVSDSRLLLVICKWTMLIVDND